MTPQTISLAVVGARFPNKRGPDRRFEILLCKSGDRVDLVHEPNNPADEYAIAVFSERGVQMGYITAERAPYILRVMREAPETIAVFQRVSEFGAVIRVSFDGTAPMLTDSMTGTPRLREGDSGFWPDYIPPDD